MIYQRDFLIVANYDLGLPDLVNANATATHCAQHHTRHHHGYCCIFHFYTNGLFVL